MMEQHRLTPGKPVKLSKVSTKGTDFGADRDAAEKEFDELKDELEKLQHRFYADGRFKLLIVLQAMDCGGKDGTIRNVFSGINPQGVRVTPFKAPTAEELAHDYLWRIHKHVPRKGMIGVFNRSHYEDVLIVRVDKLVPEAVWKKRYEQINEFEQLLSETGTTILKFFLNISKEEQKERFIDRIKKPHKQWKFSPLDLEKRKQWDDYIEAYDDALNRCTTEYAPWYVVPSDQKWYRNLVVIKVIVDAIQKLNPQFPAPYEDIDRVRFD
jgi:PPK2 family polyphosphate:nucleotide phosphotransferase